MTIKGTITRIDDTNQVSDKFKKRTFRVKTDESYPQVIELQMNQDKCDILNKYTIGQPVECHINLRGREWHDSNSGYNRCFVTVECWRIVADQSTMTNEAASDCGSDDLPF